MAELLLENADGTPDPGAEAAWEAEILGRVRAVEAGRVVGVPYEEVMRAAERRLAG